MNTAEIALTRRAFAGAWWMLADVLTYADATAAKAHQMGHAGGGAWWQFTAKGIDFGVYSPARTVTDRLAWSSLTKAGRKMTEAQRQAIRDARAEGTRLQREYPRFKCSPQFVGCGRVDPEAGPTPEQAGYAAEYEVWSTVTYPAFLAAKKANDDALQAAILDVIDPQTPEAPSAPAWTTPSDAPMLTKAVRGRHAQEEALF